MTEMFVSRLVYHISVFIMIICNLVFLVVTFIHKNKLRRFSLFKVYGIVAIVEDVLALGPAPAQYTHFTMFAFTFIETIAFYSVLYNRTSNNSLRRTLPLLGKIFTIATTLLVLFVFTALEFWATSAVVSYYIVLCNFINLAAALYYLYRLVAFPTEIPLTQDPAFWICVGILVLSALDIPVFLMSSYLEYNDLHWAMRWCYVGNAIAYSFLFICLTISCLKSRDLTELIPGTTTKPRKY
jgi:hypothetical protein